MNPSYLILFNLSTLLYALISTKIDIHKVLKLYVLFFHALVVALFVTMRDFDYGDTQNYANFYISDYVYLDIEPLFESLASMFRFFYPLDPTYFFFTITFLTVLILNYSLYKLFPYAMAIILIWAFSSFYSFFYFTFETIRDGLAYSILFYAFTYLVNNKNIKKYLFFVFIASMFHYTYMIFIFLPLILKLNSKIFIVVLLATAYFSSSIFLNIIAELDPSLGILVKKVAIYQEMSSESKTILIRNIFFIIMIPFVYKYTINDIYSKVYLFFVFILVFTLPFDEMNRRFLFKGTLLLLIPIVIFVFRYKLLLPFVFLIIVYFNLFLINYNAMYGLLNYKPFIEFKF